MILSEIFALHQLGIGHILFNYQILQPFYAPFALFGYYRLFRYNSGSPYKRLATDNDILFIVEAEFLLHTAYPVRHQMFLSESYG